MDKKIEELRAEAERVRDQKCIKANSIKECEDYNNKLKEIEGLLDGNNPDLNEISDIINNW